MSKSAEKSYGRLRVAANLRAARLAAGLSQEDLAIKAGFHRSYVSQVERGITNITIDNACRLADFLGVDLAMLFSAEGLTKPPK
ncbi:helix-turn-helix transcriptional regulator [Cupriavidus sp. WKF15]|uniref:helix-turn-helix domain-containing protein n=1 Tax=Cupriavidus sp. WKF15 TaxID=3032282 RepID=UPI0023E0ED63|nr:helix-turn-helix transcriptional regulator [Cupriavidus sp. WKF15]WER49968.1 helix-turn-helix transcriptional regulator [Cupriavidus sp. WKF15]